jgi:mono/diheme cytochrome c family protein
MSAAVLKSVLVAGVITLHAGAVAAQDPVADRGRQVYDKWCTPCHGAGEGKPGTIAAAALYKGSKPAVLIERTDLTAAGIKTAVRNGVFVMPRFRKTEITDADLDAIVAYLMRSSAPKK